MRLSLATIAAVLGLSMLTGCVTQTGGYGGRPKDTISLKAATYTHYLNLSKPGTGDLGWDVPVNANFDTIDLVLGRAHTIEGKHNADLTSPAATTGKYAKWDGTNWVADTPAGGGDMTKAAYDVDADSDIDVAAGGTEKSSWTQYAIPYLSATTSFGEIPIGTAGQYLKIAAGATGYAWDTPAGGSGDITTVGDVASGAAFDGSQGNTLTFKGATSGTVAVKPTAVAGTNTLTLPAETGTVVTSVTAMAGDVTGTIGATVVGDDSHAHTSSTLSGIDISLDTNLSGDTENVLTGDALSIGAGMTRDTEWDTAAEINAATTDNDFSLTTHNHTGTYQPADTDLDDLADGTLTGSKVEANSSMAAGVVTSGAAQNAKVWKTDAGGVPGWRTDETGAPGAGDIEAVGDVATGAAFTVDGTAGTKLYFYDVSGRGQLTIADLSEARTYTLPNATGEVSLLGQTIEDAEVSDTITVGASGSVNDAAIPSGVTRDTEVPGLETNAAVDSEAELEAILSIGFGTSKVATAGYILVADGTDFESVVMSADATIASGGAVTVANDSHTHGTTTIADLDISADTNLAATTPIVLTDDTLSFASTGTLDTDWDTEAEVQTAWGSVNIILETEMDGSPELLALVDDETGTGVLVFGTSPTIATPVLTLADGNGAAPTVDGQIKYDRTAEKLQVGDGAISLTVGAKTKSRSFVIKSPVVADDFPFWQTPRAIVITAVSARCIGGTNVIGQLQEYDGAAANPADCEAADWTITTAAEYTDAAFTDPNIDAGDWLGFKTTSVADAPTFMCLTFEYYEQ